MPTGPNSSLTYASVLPGDEEHLVSLRIAAMRVSLERIGRFDPERARTRLLDGFDPSCACWIEWNGARAGFYVLRECEGGHRIEHLYIHPDFQRKGIGAQIMARLIGQASDGTSIYVTALRGSEANRFYRSHGFQPVAEREWDIDYVRRSV